MARQSKYDWDAIQKVYEDPDRKIPVTKIAEQFNMKATAIRCRASQKSWISPLKARRAAMTQLELRKKQAEEKLTEKLLSEAEEKLEVVNRHAYDAAVEGLQKFSKTAPKPKDYGDANKALELAERALGINRDEGPKMGVNINLLSTPQPTLDV